ncbi:hypothetical protein ABZU75_13015 [Streptosporangium sp. NPDC005286]|uniref:hypothetical protein n=1 Tax=Streptosporangium sp. NPDC005286 TaxID=3154463 RepID=UPI0033B127FA
MLDEFEKVKGPSSDGRVDVRMPAIVCAATALAFCTAAPVWAVVDRVLGGTSGPLVPLLAALAAAGIQFLKTFDLLHRIIR